MILAIFNFGFLKISFQLFLGIDESIIGHGLSKVTKAKLPNTSFVAALDPPGVVVNFLIILMEDPMELTILDVLALSTKYFIFGSGD